MTDLESVELAARRAGLVEFADQIAKIVRERQDESDRRNREDNERRETSRKAMLERGKEEVRAIWAKQNT